MIGFEIPSNFIPMIESGQLTRYGAILKDVKSGKIIGHLKEVGNISETLSKLPMPNNPLSSASKIIQNFQLGDIGKTLESLQMINTIGSMASVASLGVSVVGFAVVIDKLKKLDEKLDVVLEKIDRVKEILDDLHMKNEVLEFAKIKTASEQLHNAMYTNDSVRRRDLLTQANTTFHIYRNYYSKIAQNYNLWEDGKLPLEVANDLYSRYITCVMGQLYSEFLLGDLSSFQESWKAINQEVLEISQFDKIKVLRAKTDSNNLSLFGKNSNELLNKINNTSSLLNETSKRIETMTYEAKYLQDKNIKPFDYFKELRSLEDDIVLIYY